MTGTILRVALPDGTVFWSTGRANVLPTGGFALTVDSGHSGNLDAFCAALEGNPWTIRLLSIDGHGEGSLSLNSAPQPASRPGRPGGLQFAAPTTIQEGGP